MSLLSCINKHCPVISHIHTRINKNTKLTCCICNENYNFCKIPICIDNNNYIKKKINKKIEITIYLTLIKKDLNYDVIGIIVDMLSEKYYKLNINNIEHFMKCKKCAPHFLNYINNNACGKHILPRINNDNNSFN